MTPSALTPAARRTKPPARSAGHRSPLAPGVAPRSPRRVSGPAGGLTRGRAETAPRPSRPARPRRAVPRPGIGGLRRRGARSHAVRAPLPARIAAYVRALPDHSLLDRIVRGRAWIPILGVLLAGIVFMQVEVLKLNAGIGRSLATGATLQSENQLLQADVSRLSDDTRIERMAAQLGMVMPAPELTRFLPAHAGSVAAALNNIHQPNTQTFQANMNAEENAGIAAATGADNGTTAADTGTTGTAAGTTATTPTAASSSSAATGTGTPATGGSDSGASAAASSPATSSAPATVTPVAPSQSSSSSPSASGGVGAASSGN